GQRGGIAGVEVGDLVIGDGEGGGGEGVEQAACGVARDVEQPRFPQPAVDVDGSGHVGDAVFGEHDDGRPGCADVIDQIPCHAVDLRGRGDGVGAATAVALQVVVEVRQVDQ